MSKDLRASQLQTTQIISSGSSGTNARIVVYPVEKQLEASPNQGIIDSEKFGTGSIGSDIFIYVSGGIGERNISSSSIAVFGGDVHISGNLTSDQQTFAEENFFRLEIVDFATTEQTSSNPEVVGQLAFPADEFNGDTLTLRAILANTDGSGIAAIKLFNLTDLAFVEIAGPSQEELSVTGSTPTLVESINLVSASGFNTSSAALYELHLFSSTGSNTAQVGGGEFRPSGSFSSFTTVTQSFVSQFISGTTGFRIGMVDFAQTSNTSSNPLIVGQVIFPANEFSGSLTFRSVLSTTDSATTASVRLYNATSGAYVELLSGQDELTTTELSPTIVTSQDLFEAVNFNTSSQSVYEVHLHTSDATNEVLIGGSEFRPSGSFTGQTINNSFFVSGTWIDSDSKLRTTASVAIDSDGNFAENRGEDVYFYVSGTITSGSAGDAISVFGGSVRVSGTLAVGSSSLFVSDGMIASSGTLEIRTFNLTGSAPSLTFQAGNAPHADAAGGSIALGTGNAGQRTSGKRAAGSLTVTLGSGSYSNSVAGDVGGSFSLTTGQGGGGADSATAAGSGGNIGFSGGAGGAGTGTTTNGGSGAAISFSAGTGGASNNADGGDGGAITLTLGSPGDGAAGIPGEAGIFKIVGGAMTTEHFNNSGSTCQIGVDSLGSVQKFRHISFNGLRPGDTGFQGSDIVFYVSGVISGANASTPGIAVFGGDLHSSGNLIYGHSEDAFNQRVVSLFRTTGSEVGTVLTYAVTGSKLYDFDFTIMAVGTGSGITKRFKRNLSVAAFDSPFILTETVFATVPDVTGSAAADDLDVTFEVSSNNLLVHVSGTTSQSVTWQCRAEITKQSN